MVATLKMPAKLATLGLLKLKSLWNKGYDIIISVHDAISQILLSEPNYTVDVVICP